MEQDGTKRQAANLAAAATLCVVLAWQRSGIDASEKLVYVCIGPDGRRLPWGRGRADGKAPEVDALAQALANDPAGGARILRMDGGGAVRFRTGYVHALSAGLPDPWNEAVLLQGGIASGLATADEVRALADDAVFAAFEGLRADFERTLPLWRAPVPPPA